MPATTSIDLFALVAGLLGGLGLFLLGLRQLTDALKRLAGDQLTRLLTRLTTNRVAAALTGITVTAIVQSSSVTTVLAVGFVTAGVMSFQQSIGVVLGANVGTTITTQAIAFDLANWAYALVAVGALGLVFGRSGRFETRATAVLGLGLVFVGMQVMSGAVAPLRTSEVFLEAMTRLANPVLGVAAGAALTAILQSSSATSAMVITLAGQGLIGLPAGAAVIVGANVGSCVTAVLAAIGKPVAARRVAAFHVTVNVLGAAAWVGFLDELVRLAGTITPPGADDARRLANTHTVFNVSVLAVLLPLAGPLGRLVERLVPDRPGGVPRPVAPLDDALLTTPALALAACRKAIGELGAQVVDLVRRAPQAVLSGDRRELDRLPVLDDEIDRRYGDVLAYLARLGREPMSDDQTAEHVALLTAASALEAIGDLVETNLFRVGSRRLRAGITHRPERIRQLHRVHAMVLEALEQACRAISHHDDEPARAVLASEGPVRAAVDALVRQWTAEIDPADPAALEAALLELDVLEQLRRVASVARRIARARLGTDDTGAEGGP